MVGGMLRRYLHRGKRRLDPNRVFYGDLVYIY